MDRQLLLVILHIQRLVLALSVHVRISLQVCEDEIPHFTAGSNTDLYALSSGRTK